MKTALTTACFLEGEDALGNNRLERNLRYLEYYRKLKLELGFSEFMLFDNASDMKLIQKLGLSLVAASPFVTINNAGREPVSAKNISVWKSEDITMFRFDDRLTKNPQKINDYPYCWRALYSLSFAFNYDKLIGIDSDGFVLTKRMAKYIKEANSGWVSFFCPRHQFPDTSISIINRDAFSVYDAYTAIPWENRCGRLMEKDVPFTHVEKGFVCDRFGEIYPRPEQTPDKDYWGQASLTTELKFEE